MDHCDECGFDYPSLAIADAPSTIRSTVTSLATELGRTDVALVRTRPEPSTWSMLEYACHVRDVLLVQRDRILLALVEDTPHFVPMYRDARVANAGYERERPGEVVTELMVAAGLISKVLEGLDADQLARRCLYNYPMPAERDLTWVTRRAAHEIVHHDMDVRRVRSDVAR